MSHTSPTRTWRSASGSNAHQQIRDLKSRRAPAPKSHRANAWYRSRSKTRRKPKRNSHYVGRRKNAGRQRLQSKEGLVQWEAAKRWDGATCQAGAPLSQCDVSNSAKGPDVASADNRAKWLCAFIWQILSRRRFMDRNLNSGAGVHVSAPSSC